MNEPISRDAQIAFLRDEIGAGECSCGSYTCPVNVKARMFVALLQTVESDPQPFQERVREWLFACFGEAVAHDKTERVHRFIEESLELAQSLGCTRSEATQLVDYVFNRAVGEPTQEVGGTMTTLAALCFAHGFDMDADAETELARCWFKIATIRQKQAAKPKHSPLPVADTPAGPPEAPTPPTRWQPIETAPKDGSAFLAYGVHDSSPVDAQRGVKAGDHWWAIILWDIWRINHLHRVDAESRWCFTKDGKPTWSEPTHWMPLPAAPLSSDIVLKPHPKKAEHDETKWPHTAGPLGPCSPKDRCPVCSSDASPEQAKP